MLLPNILNEKGLFGRLALLQMESLATLTSDLSRLLDQADKHTHTSSTDTHTLSQLTLDRLAQALQVAMANGALLCSRGKMVAVTYVRVNGCFPLRVTPVLNWRPFLSPNVTWDQLQPSTTLIKICSYGK